MFKKNSSKKNKKFAFSLIELSIVILVIGILMVGVNQGYNLVRSAQISNARSITAKSPILQLSGLMAWYETSLKESLNQSNIVDGNSLTAWKDISPNSILNGANQLTPSTVSSAITYLQSSINKIPAIKFNGSSKLSIANLSQGASSQATVFLVIKLNYTPNSTDYKTIFDGNSATFSFSIKSDAVQINMGDATPISTTYSTGFSNAGEYVIAVYFNGSNSKVFINNTTSAISTSDIASTGTNQLAGITIGANRSGANGFAGFISEVAIFNRVIKSTERKEIFNYFSKKYKIDITGV